LQIGVIIIGIVILALLGYLGKGFFLNADIPLALRIGVGVIGGGVLALVVRTIRARLTRIKTEESKEEEE
jgi:hypothetical protein